MPDNLLRPDNRSLGWSTGDFSLYGTQPDTAVTIGRADPDASLAPPHGVAAAQADPAPEPHPLQQTSTPDDIAYGDVVGASDSASAPAIPPPEQSASRSDTTDAAELIDRVGGGSTQPGILLPTVASAQAPDGSRLGNDGDVGATATIITGGVADGFTTSPLVAAATPASIVVETGATALGGIVTTAAVGLLGSDDDILQPLTDTVASVSSGVGSVLGPVAATVDAIGNQAGDIVSSTEGTVTSIGDDVVAAATETVGAAATGLSETTASIAGAAQDVLDAGAVTVGTVGQTASDLAGAAGAVQDVAASVPMLAEDATIAGSDPVGGVATLVDLVQTSELFFVGQSDSAPEAPDAGGSIVDSLIGGDDAPDAAQVDDVAHHSPADLVDDLHLGL